MSSPYSENIYSLDDDILYEKLRKVAQDKTPFACT